jgi:hypothetical protein
LIADPREAAGQEAILAIWVAEALMEEEAKVSKAISLMVLMYPIPIGTLQHKNGKP